MGNECRQDKTKKAQKRYLLDANTHFKSFLNAACQVQLLCMQRSQLTRKHGGGHYTLVGSTCLSMSPQHNYLMTGGFSQMVNNLN